MTILTFNYLLMANPFVANLLNTILSPIIEILTNAALLSVECYEYLLQQTKVAETVLACLPYCWNPSRDKTVECPAIARIQTIMKNGFLLVNEVAL